MDLMSEIFLKTNSSQKSNSIELPGPDCVKEALVATALPEKLLSSIRVPTTLASAGVIGVVEPPTQLFPECTAPQDGPLPEDASNQQPQPAVIGSHHCHNVQVP